MSDAPTYVIWFADFWVRFSEALVGYGRCENSTRLVVGWCKMHQ